MPLPLQHSLRSTMRGTHLDSGSTMLSRNNLQRSSASQPAPVRRSDSARIETWRDEVVVCCGRTPPSTGSSASSSNSSADPSLDPNAMLPVREREKEGRMSRVKSKFKRRSAGPGAETLVGGEVARTSMYDGNRPGERPMEQWEEGAGESLYFGSMGLSEGGRLDRAEQLLSGACEKRDKDIEEEGKGVRQATT